MKIYIAFFYIFTSEDITWDDFYKNRVKVISPWKLLPSSGNYFLVISFPKLSCRLLVYIVNNNMDSQES